jgi:hypothetical protein
MLKALKKIFDRIAIFVDKVTGKEYPSHFIKRSEYMLSMFLKWVKGRVHEKWDNTYVIKLNYNEALIKVVSPQHNLGVLKDNPLIRVKILGDCYYKKGQVIAGVITNKISWDVLEAMPLPFQDKVGPNGMIRILWK